MELKKKVAYHCPTITQAVELVALAVEQGLEVNCDDPEAAFESHGEFLCYYIEYGSLCYGGIDWVRTNGHEVIEFGKVVATYLTIGNTNTVDKPKHYIGDHGLEVEDVLRNFIPRYENPYVAHRIASAIEYLLRSPLKNGKEDIEKARYNLTQALMYIEEVTKDDC